jgi:hypothetical protein
MASYTPADLEAYLDEALPVEEMTRIEEALRSDRQLLALLTHVNSRRDGGAHTVGEIWRRRRLSCPTRDELGSFLLGAGGKDLRAYIAFHLDVVGCRICQANRDDLGRQQAEQSDAAQSRRRKYFQSSAGYLRK